MIAAWALLTAVGCVGAAVFAGLYGARSPGWYMSPTGRNLMAMAVTLAALLALSLVGLLVRIWPWLWLGGMATLDVVLWWRVAILYRLQRRSR